MSKVIDTGYVEIRPQLARNFTADASAQARPAVAALQRDFDKTAAVATGSDAKVRASALRVTAAQERLNLLRQQGVTDVGRLAAAEATLISSQDRLVSAQRRGSVGAQAPLREQVRGTQSLALGLAGLASGAYILRELAHGYVQGAQAASQLSLAQAQSVRTVDRLGQSSGITTGNIDQQAEAASRAGVATQTQATAAQNLLATYSALTSQGVAFFDRSFHAVEDLATFSANLRGTQVDLVATAKALGSALQDPAAGLTRLTRLGVAFTAQQKEQVKELAKNGQLTAAQARIIELVEGKVAGSTATFSASTAGSLSASSKAFEDFQRAVAQDALPAVTRGLNDVTGALDFLRAHATLRQPVEALVLGAGGLYALSKTVKIARDIRDTLRPIRTAETVAQNNLVADSYANVARSATAAAGAETAASRAGTAGGLRLPGGRGTPTAGAGVPLPAALLAALVLGPPEFAAARRVGSGHGSLTDYGLAALGGIGLPVAAGTAIAHYLPRLFGGGGHSDTPPPATPADPFAALLQREADVEKLIATRTRLIRTAERTAAPTGLFDALPAKPTVDLAGLNDRAANAAGRVANAQDRLNGLRAKGTTSAAQLASAERSLAAAQRSAEAAQRALADGQRKANQTTALSAADVLKRANYNADAAASQIRAEKRLLREGLSVGAVRELETVEAQNKGTITRLAKNLTQTQIDQLDKDAAKRAKAVGDMSAIDKLSANLKGRAVLLRLGEQQAQWQREGYERAIRSFRAGIPGPTSNAPLGGLAGELLPPGVTINDHSTTVVHTSSPRLVDIEKQTARRRRQTQLTGSAPTGATL